MINMKIGTRFFGEIEIDEKSILKFHDGIPGSEEHKEFVMLDIEDYKNLKCLQSILDYQICLLMISPWNYISDYEVQLSDNEIDTLKIQMEQDVAVYNIIKVTDNKVTANLLAPVVINVKNNNGKQIILSNSKYSIRQEISC
jgi:flagellar assembly factor FliW